MIFIECLLNASWRPQTSKRAQKSLPNKVGQKKKRERERGIRMGPRLPPGRMLWKRKHFHTMGCTLTGEERIFDRGEILSLRGEYSHQFAVVKGENNLHIRSVPPPAGPSLRSLSSRISGGWGLRFRFRGQTQGEDFYLLHGDHLKGQRCGEPKPRKCGNKLGPTTKSGLHYCGVGRRRAEPM